MILVTLLPIISSLGYYIWLQYDDLVSDSFDEAIGIVSNTAQYDKGFLEQASETLKNIVYVPAIRNENWRICSEYLKIVNKNAEQYLSMGVIDVYGKLACSGRSEEKI